MGRKEKVLAPTSMATRDRKRHLRVLRSTFAKSKRWSMFDRPVYRDSWIYVVFDFDAENEDWVVGKTGPVRTGRMPTENTVFKTPEDALFELSEIWDRIVDPSSALRGSHDAG